LKGVTFSHRQDSTKVDRKIPVLDHGGFRIIFIKKHLNISSKTSLSRDYNPSILTAFPRTLDPKDPRWQLDQTSVFHNNIND
jgi:hypothetical protein